MTVIADLLDRDPRGQRLVNNGQARLSDTSEDENRGELRIFVCEGRYADGITRILRASPVMSARRASRPRGSAASSGAASRTF